MQASLAQRLKKLEGSRRRRLDGRWSTAMDTLLHSMEPEHVRFLQRWMGEHVGGLRIPLRPGETFSTLYERYKPPALVRAVWLLMFEHMDSHAPVSLPADVAEIYLADSDAFPVNPCEDCRYLLPARAKLRPDNTYEFPGGMYLGECPVCWLDNHPKEDEET